MNVIHCLIRSEKQTNECPFPSSYSNPDVLTQGPRNPYTRQMNGKGIGKGQKVKVNQLNNHKGTRAATKPFS